MQTAQNYQFLANISEELEQTASLQNTKIQANLDEELAQIAQNAEFEADIEEKEEEEEEEEEIP